MYVITGATGNTGKIITNALLDAGKKVRIICRDAAKAKELIGKGAELFQGDTTDVEFLKKAFSGANAVYAIIPPDWTTNDFRSHQMKHIQAMAEAIKVEKVKYVVSLSSQGAHLESGSGVVLGLHKMEKAFNAVPGLNTLHLRPTYFMENTLGMAGLIKQAGIMGSPVKPDLRFPMIATKDIGNYAAKRLLKLDFTGNNVQDLLGPEDVSYTEVAKIYGAEIGKPELPYIQFSYEDFKNAMVGQMGASESMADNMIEFVKAMNEGKVTVAIRTSESTTPTSIKEFSKTFAYVYNMN
jgi:uncharacterized protein YbjT (DUF2867 family)